MAYTKTAWNEGAAPGISAENLNNLETQYDEAASDAATHDANVVDSHGRVAGVLPDGQIPNLAASKTTTGAFHVDRIPSLAAAKITSGEFAVARGGTGLAAIASGGILYTAAGNVLSRIAPSAANQVLRSTGANALQIAALVAADIPNLDAAKVTTGTFADARIPNLDTAKVTSGTFADARIPALVARINSGTYTGNAATNRAIPHGLGRTPKLVIIQKTSDGEDYSFRSHRGGDVYYQNASFGASGMLAVTAWNATHFHVGNPAHLERSANANVVDYHWVAFG